MIRWVRVACSPQKLVQTKQTNNCWSLSKTAPNAKLLVTPCLLARPLQYRAVLGGTPQERFKPGRVTNNNPDIVLPVVASRLKFYHSPQVCIYPEVVAEALTHGAPVSSRWHNLFDDSKESLGRKHDRLHSNISSNISRSQYAR